jgi:hypothetical protein
MKLLRLMTVAVATAGLAPAALADSALGAPTARAAALRVSIKVAKQATLRYGRYVGKQLARGATKQAQASGDTGVVSFYGDDRGACSRRSRTRVSCVLNMYFGPVLTTCTGLVEVYVRPPSHVLYAKLASGTTHCENTASSTPVLGY